MKQKNIRGDVKETDKYSWRRERNRQIFVETLKKQTNIGGDVKGTANIREVVKETDKCSWRRESNRQIFVETLKKKSNIGEDVKETDKYWWRR